MVAGKSHYIIGLVLNTNQGIEPSHLKLHPLTRVRFRDWYSCFCQLRVKGKRQQLTQVCLSILCISVLGFKYSNFLWQISNQFPFYKSIVFLTLKNSKSHWTNSHKFRCRNKFRLCFFGDQTDEKKNIYILRTVPLKTITSRQ